MNKKSALTEPEIEAFWKFCQWAYDVCLFHKTLFDTPHEDLLQRSRHGPALRIINIMSQEHGLLQLAKLHDPPRQSGRDNLTLSYILERVDWEPSKAAKLQELYEKMEAFSQNIKPARNRILAHIDHHTFTTNEELGAFEKDAEWEYLRLLQEFIGEVQGKPFEFAQDARADAEILLKTLVRDASR
jgi:hypothetical protein